MNETRTARVIAVIAGNGFFLSKLADTWVNSYGRNQLNASALILALLALTGIATAYVSLFGKSESRWPLVLEIVAALTFVTNAFWWLATYRHGPLV